MSIVRNGIRKSIKDIEGNIILSATEQKKLLLSHLYDLLEIKKFNSAKTQLLAFFVLDNHKIKDDGDLCIQINFILNDIKKIQDFFRNITQTESHEFFKNDFLFGKKLKPMQKTLALSWYVANCKAIDAILKQALKKVNITKE